MCWLTMPATPAIRAEQLRAGPWPCATALPGNETLGVATPRLLIPRVGTRVVFPATRKDEGRQSRPLLLRIQKVLRRSTTTRLAWVPHPKATTTTPEPRPRTRRPAAPNAEPKAVLAQIPCRSIVSVISALMVIYVKARTWCCSTDFTRRPATLLARRAVAAKMFHSWWAALGS